MPGCVHARIMKYRVIKLKGTEICCTVTTGININNTKSIKPHSFARHESQSHVGVENDNQVVQQHTESAEDYLKNYHRAKLAFGLIIFEFDDAIKEGDGERLHDFYKLAVLMYKAYGKTKYAYAVLLYLVKVEGILSEEDAHYLKWNRFFNKHGTKGGNIPLDLRMEQLNKIVKTMWRSLGANISENSAARLANTVQPMEMVLDSIDKDCSLTQTPGRRSTGKPEVPVAQMVNDLMQIKAFRHQPGRKGHPSYPAFPRNILKSLDYRDLHSWMTGLIKTWEPLHQ